MNRIAEQIIVAWFGSVVLGAAALGCVEKSVSNRDAGSDSTADGGNKPDAQTGFVPEGEYDSAVDLESLEDFGITTLEATTCGGAESTGLAWGFTVHSDQASFDAAYEYQRGWPPRFEVDFETHVVIEIHSGEWGGCGEYVELTGARDSGDAIEVGARFVAVCGDDGESYPYLFASAPRLDKPYVVIQEDSRCPPCHAGGSITLRCRNEETRRCAGPHPNECPEGTVRVLPPAAVCTISETSSCPEYEGCLMYAGRSLNMEAGCWAQQGVQLDCAPLPDHCFSGECDDGEIDGGGCSVELATGTLFNTNLSLDGNPRFRACTDEERASAARSLPFCE